MVPCDSDDISKDFSILLHELEMYNPELLDKPRLLAVTKSDLIDEEMQQMLVPTLPPDIEVVFISAVTGYNLMTLKDKLWILLTGQ
jgi:GTP-binding protein